MADAPLCGIEVVGAGAEVVDKAEGVPLKADEDVATRNAGPKHEGFAAQIGKSVVERELCTRKGVGSEFRRECQRRGGLPFVALAACEEYAWLPNVAT